MSIHVLSNKIKFDSPNHRRRPNGPNTPRPRAEARQIKMSPALPGSSKPAPEKPSPMRRALTPADQTHPPTPGIIRALHRGRGCYVCAKGQSPAAEAGQSNSPRGSGAETVTGQTSWRKYRKPQNREV